MPRQRAPVRSSCFARPKDSCTRRSLWLRRWSEYLGDKTGAWSTTISYDNAVITPENLKQYDAIFLDSTTGEFLDDANDPSGTQTRRKALLDFVKNGKGLAGIHAASDSYHDGIRGEWPEFNQMIGGFFKFHWSYPTLIPVKIDDPKSPLTQMFDPRGVHVIADCHGRTQLISSQTRHSRRNIHGLRKTDRLNGAFGCDCQWAGAAPSIRTVFPS